MPKLPKRIRYIPGMVIHLYEKVFRGFFPLRVVILERMELDKASLTLLFDRGDEKTRTRIMPIPKFREFLTENMFESIEYPKDEDELVAVCGSCHRAICLNGDDECGFTGPRAYKTKRDLRSYNLESEDNWKG